MRIVDRCIVAHFHSISPNRVLEINQHATAVLAWLFLHWPPLVLECHVGHTKPLGAALDTEGSAGSRVETIHMSNNILKSLNMTISNQPRTETLCVLDKANKLKQSLEPM